MPSVQLEGHGVGYAPATARSPGIVRRQGPHREGEYPMGAFSGLLDSGSLYVKFEEAVHDGMRLGRNLWLDGRSLAHMIENNVEAMSGTNQSTEWERVLTILDQG